MNAVKKLILIIAVQVLVMAAVLAYALTGVSEHTVVSPGLSGWDSRIAEYEGTVWHVDTSLYPEESEPGVETDFLFGPFIAVDKGCYSVNIDYECDEDQTFEVYSYGSEDKVISHEKQVLKAGAGTCICHFTLLGNVEDLEVRIHYNGIGNLTISNINIITSRFLIKEVLIALAVLFIILDVCLYLIFTATPGDGTRQAWIDCCRGIGILLVLIGHTDPPFKWLIFGFHVPLFFIISGYLYRDSEDTAGYVSKLFKRLMIPYFALCVINLVITLVRTAVTDVITPEWVFKWLKAIVYSDEWLPDCLPLWFLPAMFLTMVGFHLLHKTGSREIRVAVIVICALLVCWMDHTDCPDLPWGIGQAVMGLVFAQAGNILRKYNLIDAISKLKPVNYIGVVIVMIVCGINSIWLNYSTTDSITAMRSMRYGHFPLWITGAVLTSVVLMSICARSYRVSSGIVLYPLSALGRHTILFFGFDFAMGTLSEYILGRLLHYDPWYYVCGIKLILLMAVFFVWYGIKCSANKRSVNRQGEA